MLNVNEEKPPIYPPRLHFEETQNFFTTFRPTGLDRRQVASYVNAVTVWDKSLNALQNQTSFFKKILFLFPKVRKSRENIAKTLTVSLTNINIYFHASVDLCSL
ncbi:hypothetical protein CEXT_311911 [Caerostris extrusa]|uniref:Uncharacterized protein n=1 Tax=Caerostris extrusa TaxID=172846 RepID=A0AAV4SYQ6_CAEEX|nr:hypothetical protein CEXT_311911 [Caerostris extrusa]